MSTIIESIEKEQLRSVPRFGAGDRLRVHFRVIEGSRTRTQVFEGIVIKRQGQGSRASFTVRKQSFGVGVERTFPVHSPKIERLEIAAKGDVRRARLYYLRNRVGKAARVAERRWGIADDFFDTAQQGAADPEGTYQEEAEPELVPTEAEEGAGGAESAEAAAEGGAEGAEAPEAEGAEQAEAAGTEDETGGEGEEAAEAEAGGAEAEADQAGEPEGGSTEDEASERAQ